MRNMGGIRLRQKEEGMIICTICWVKTPGGIQRVMKGDRQISGESDAARRKDSKENAAISTKNHKIPCFGWITPPEVENQ